MQVGTRLRPQPCRPRSHDIRALGQCCLLKPKPQACPGLHPGKGPSSSPHYPPAQLCESPSTLLGRLTGSHWAADASVYTRHILGTRARTQVRRRMALKSPGQSSAHISLTLDSSDVS